MPTDRDEPRPRRKVKGFPAWAIVAGLAVVTAVLCGGVGVVAILAALTAKQKPVTPVEVVAAESNEAAAAKLDLDDPRSVLAYWVSFKSVKSGNALVDDPKDPDGLKKYRARVLDKPVRWPAVVTQVDATGTIWAETAIVYWPFKDQNEWQSQTKRPPEDLHGLIATAHYRVGDLEWAKTLRPKTQVVITGTLWGISDGGLGRVHFFDTWRQPRTVEEESRATQATYYLHAAALRDVKIMAPGQSRPPGPEVEQPRPSGRKPPNPADWGR